MQSTPDLQIFHNDLRAAVRAGVELEIGDQPVPDSKLDVRRLEELEAMVAADQNVPDRYQACLLYTSPSPRDRQKSRMPSSA